MSVRLYGMLLPLPWFVQGHNAALKKVSYLENFPAYIRNTAINNYNKFLNEFNERNFYKPHERPPYSTSVIWFALHLRYISLQVYRLFFEKFPMSSLSLLTLRPRNTYIYVFRALLGFCNF